jgi:RimJ/RimL family protein N-acetyltransferase
MCFNSRSSSVDCANQSFSLDSSIQIVSAMKIILETARLLLREMTIDDLDFIANMLADAEVMRYYPRCCTREESEAWILRQRARYARDGFGFWLAATRAGDEPVGQAGLLMQDLDGVMQVGLGYLVHRPFWRRGFAHEACTGILDHAFGSLGLARVVCPIRPENEPSRRLAEKLGMVPDRQTEYAGFRHIIYTRDR